MPVDHDTADEKSLEWQYNPRVSITNAAADIERAQQLSADTMASLQRRADIRHGPGPKETFDLYPATGTDAPVHVFIHGGYWRAQDKVDYAFVARELVSYGVSVAIVNYDLCPAVTISDIVAECVRCIHYIVTHADDLGVDADRLTVSGHSAGGQLVAKLLCHDWQGEGLARHPIHAAAAISGVFDLAPLIDTSINDAIGLTADTARQNSPLFDPPPPANVPLLLAVGGDETPAFHEQTQRYADHCRAAGVSVEQMASPGCNHMTVLDALFVGPDAPMIDWTRRVA